MQFTPAIQTGNPDPETIQADQGNTSPKNDQNASGLVESAIATAGKSAQSAKKKKVKRSKIPAPAAPFNPVDNALVNRPGSKEHAPVNYLTAQLIEEPHHSLKDYGLTQDDIKLLREIFSSSPLSGFIGIFENLVFHIHNTSSRLSALFRENLKCLSLDKLVDEMIDKLQLNLYEILIQVHVRLVIDIDRISEITSERKFFRDIHQEISASLRTFYKLEECIYSDQVKNSLLASYSRFKTKMAMADKSISQAAHTVKRIIRALEISQGLLSLPKERLHSCSVPGAISFFEFNRDPSLEPQRVLDEIQKHSKFILDLVELAQQKGIVSTYLEPKGCLNALFKCIEDIFVASPHRNPNDFKMKGRELIQAVDTLSEFLFMNRNLFVGAYQGKITHAELYAGAVASQKTQNEFSAQLFMNMLNANLIFDNLSYLHNCSIIFHSVANTYTMHGPHKAQAVLSWFEIRNGDPKNRELMQAIRNVTINQVMRTVQDPSVTSLMEDYTREVVSIYTRVQHLFTLEQRDLIENFADASANPEWFNIFMIKEQLLPVKEALCHLRAKAKEYNQKVQTQCEELLLSKRMTMEEVSSLMKTMEVLNADLTPILAPYYDFTEHFFAAVKSVKSKSKRSDLSENGVIEFHIRTSDLPWLFHLEGEAHWAKFSPPAPLDQQLSQATETDTISHSAHQEIHSMPKEAASALNLEEAAPELDPPAESYPKAEEEERSGIESVKLRDLLQFLSERGWKVHSIRGSHLKLRMQNESLIVPINKKELKRGTMGAIIRQEEEKRGKH